VDLESTPLVIAGAVVAALHLAVAVLAVRLRGQPTWRRAEQ
jgi:hypothetical protein